MRIIIWGAGNNGKWVIEQIKKKCDLFVDEYLGVIDNDVTKKGQVLDTFRVYGVDFLENCQFDYIVLKSRFDVEIRRQLICENKIDSDKIITFEQYMGMCYSRHEYNKRYKGMEVKKNKVFDTNKLVVYTANFGKYDELADPLYVNESITYVCFTDDKDFKSNIWNVEYVDCGFNEERLMSKKVKFRPDIYFGDYSTSIWIDAKFYITSSLVEYVHLFQKESSILCFPHNERNCLYDEAGACLMLKRGKKEDIIRQVSDYYQMGIPFSAGLYESGCMVRNHNDDLVKKMMDEWKRQIHKYSNRDQISLPFVFQKFGFLPDICDANLYCNKWMKFKGHVNVEAMYSH